MKEFATPGIMMIFILMQRKSGRADSEGEKYIEKIEAYCLSRVKQ